MKPQVRYWLGIALIALTAVFIYLYQFFGLKYYLHSLELIKSASPEDQRHAWDTLNLDPKIDFAYNGILAHASKSQDKITGIWIWGTKGLKYFKTGMNTTFSYFSICKDEKWKTGTVQVSQTSNVGSNEWQKHVRTGDYVIVNFSSQPESKDSMIINETIGFDWWVFIKTGRPGYLEEACKNR